MQNETVANALNRLIRINNDRILGYGHAANDIDDDSLRTIFANILAESLEFVNELEYYVSYYGGQPATDGSLAGEIHQSWLDFKATITGKNLNAVLGSCEFGDKAAINIYQTVLGIPEVADNTELSTLLEMQKTRIEKSLATIEAIDRDI